MGLPEPRPVLPGNSVCGLPSQFCGPSEPDLVLAVTLPQEIV